MSENRKQQRVLPTLLFTMLKIGFLAFGGGYTIIALLEREFVSGRKWVDHDEFMSVVAIAESTPGPIAVNVATYIGYKLRGLPGAVLTTFAVCFPAFFLMLLVAMCYDAFMANRYIAAAFEGVQVCIVYVIGSAGFRMLRKMKKKPLNWCILALTVCLMLGLSLLGHRISSLLYIFTSGIIGLGVYLAGFWRARRAEK